MFAPFAVYADNKYLTGEYIEPAYEGWRENPDGTFTLIFGYMNENWIEELDVPVGEENFFSPGESDRGQPTHYLPRRNRFTFGVVVPSDWGERELVWTLTSNGKTRNAYAKILPDYVIDDGGGVTRTQRYCRRITHASGTNIRRWSAQTTNQDAAYSPHATGDADDEATEPGDGIQI